MTAPQRLPRALDALGTLHAHGYLSIRQYCRHQDHLIGISTGWPFACGICTGIWARVRELEETPEEEKP